ncbi:MAG: hypothetical protein LBM28_05750 [Oscillospiraceae bacterium]|jgi:hypothetical protein|nr:hypothetical protein [Oscillospiraceae bacterium]
MTNRQFLYALRRGLGSAIVELQENPDPKYSEIVLHCCLRNIGFDTQSEGTKGDYLYTAICALGERERFAPILTEAFQKRLRHDLFIQLADILSRYCADGNQEARAAMQAKMQSLCQALKSRRSLSMLYDEVAQFESLLLREIDARGWASFPKCVVRYGEIFLARGAAFAFPDCVLAYYENTFGEKRVRRYLESASAKGDAPAAFVARYRQSAGEREAYHREAFDPNTTLEKLKSCAEGNSPEGSGAVRMYALRFGKRASSPALLRLAQEALQESNPQMKAALLLPFAYADFPPGASALLPLADCQNETLRSSIFRALERLKHQGVHDLALRLLREGNVEDGLALLKENRQEGDEEIIEKILLSSDRVTHAMQMHLSAIYEQHRSKQCGRILLHAYQHGSCSFCRHYLVSAMSKSGVLPEKILHECQWDSYSETGLWAREQIAKGATANEF